MVLHNWPEQDCYRILRALVPALKLGARIIFSEWYLPEIHTTSIIEEQKDKVSTLAVPASCRVKS